MTRPNLHEIIHSPGGDCIEKGLWHTDELRIAYGMHRCSAWRVGDHVKLSNCVSLAIFTGNYHFPIFSLSYGTQSPINDDIKAVANVLWPPKNLAGSDLHPVQRGINLQYWKEVRRYPLVVKKMHTKWRKQ